MARSRFILRYRGQSSTPDADVARVAGLTEAVVVESAPKMLLVESDQASLEALVDTLEGWVMAPEQAFALPDVRRRAERPPDPDHH